MSSMPSIDSMLGIINNNNQTASVLDNQRALTESIKTQWKETFKVYRD